MEFTEKDKTKQEQVYEIICAVAEVIEMKAKEYCKYKNDQKNFVLAVATNLLGNLCMQWSDDSLQEKVLMSLSTIKNLSDWYKVALIDYEQRKEMH